MPLSPQELTELAGMLASEATPDECMNLAELDGFFTALAIGPRLPPSDLWMPLVWGRENSLRFTPEEGVVCGRFIGRLMNDISRGFKESPPLFAPIMELVQDGKVVDVAVEWCSGFATGVLLDHEAWEPLIRDQEKGIMLAPMMALGTAEGLEALEKRPDPDAEYDDLVDVIAEFVPLIHAYWRTHSAEHNRRPTIPSIRPRSLRPSRNAPCPCGSGRKFKRCCADQPNV